MTLFAHQQEEKNTAKKEPKPGVNEKEKPADDISESETTEKPEEPLYSYAPSHKHFHLIVVTNSEVDTRNLQTNISDFNSEFFSLERLSIKTAKLGRTMNMVHVRGFKETEKCKDYYGTIKENKDVFEGLNP